MKPRKIPSYCHQKSTGQGYCRFSEPFQGKRCHYFGKFTEPGSREKYDRLIAQWLLAQHEPRAAPKLTLDDISLLNLQSAYLAHCEQRRKTGSLCASQLDRIKRSLTWLRPFDSLRCAEFGPRLLKIVRGTIQRTNPDWSNRWINSLIGVIKTMFAWGVEEELVSGDVLHALRSVKRLPVRRTVVKSVPWHVVESTLCHLPAIVADMVRVQYLAGMRPGEVCRMRFCDVDRTGLIPDIGQIDGVWVYTPARHKTTYLGHARLVVIGPQAQAILAPYMLRRQGQQYLFSPAEVAEGWLAERGRNIRRGQARAPGECYRTDSYYHAVRKAVCRANVTHWHPHQLRHSRATELRAAAGLDVAQVVLGHASMDATQIYAERDLAAAAEIMRKIG